MDLYGNPSSLGPPNTTISPDRSQMDFRTNPIDFGPTQPDRVYIQKVKSEKNRRFAEKCLKSV